jgi:DNA-binding XRE family transcriptional regulator
MSINNKRQLPSKTHKEMVSEWMKEPKFKKAYDALEDEFQILKEMLRARKRAGLTQQDVAEKMGTKAPAIARLESPAAYARSSPSLNTLRKYARAVGCTLEVHLKPIFIVKNQSQDHNKR